MSQRCRRAGRVYLFTVAAAGLLGPAVARCASSEANMGADAAVDSRDIVIAMNELGPMGSAGRGDLVVTADGTAHALHGGEVMRLSLAEPEVEQLRNELVRDLVGLDAEIRGSLATDQPFTTIRVVAPDGGDVVQTTVYGAERPAEFDRAAEQVAELAARVRAEGEVDPAAPITVTVVTGGRNQPREIVDWPESAPEPMFGENRFAHVLADGESARALREALGAADTPIGVRLPDGTPAIATWRARLPGTEE